jgi:integrase
MALTTKRVAKLTEAGRYGDGHGLYLQVTPAGVRSWLLRYERAGRERWMGLGPLHTFALEEARARARAARQQLADGIDPLDARKAERAGRALEAAKAMTFADAARQYFDQHEGKWKNRKHRAQFLATLRDYALPVLGGLPVAAIDTGLVLKCIEPIWQSKTETASRVRGRIEAILDWATVRGYRAGDNPARWKGHLGEVLPARRQIAKVQHHRALPFADVPGFVSDLQAREGMGARALEFAILTASRTGEIIGARWSEIDLDRKLWTVPAERMKGGREHRVPLSDRAIALLRALPREADFVFAGERRGTAIASTAMSNLLGRMGRLDITVHGFRSTFRDWAAETTGYPNHVVEMALAHMIGDKVEASYRRGDLFSKRSRLMADWAKYCMMKPADTAGNVTPMRGEGNKSSRGKGGRA